MLASIERISEIKEHTNADKLELAICSGYQCIVTIGKYRTNDLVVFIHPDSVLPEDREWAEPFRKFCKSRVKAVRFRGEWSFGIIAGCPMEFDELNLDSYYEGEDVSGKLGVIKYEMKYPQHQQNKLNPRRPGLPFNLVKTNEDRYQSLKRDIDKYIGTIVDVTLKIDGQSWTAYYKDGDFGVTSRSTDYKLDVDSRNNFTRHLDKYPHLQENLTRFCVDNKVNLAIRGESYGCGIQNFKVNPHAQLEPALALFSIFNLDTLKYERRDSPYYVFKLAPILDLPTVPMIEEGVELSMDLIKKYEEMKKWNGQMFEGVVINTNTTSFKVINMAYDEKK